MARHDMQTDRAPTSRAWWRSRWMGLAALVATALLIIPAAALALPGRLQLAQDDAADGTSAMPGQVIAQGIVRLPRREVAWTFRRIDVSGGEGTAIDAFPLGFGLGSGGTVALRDEAGETLGILDEGEATLLPEETRGGLSAWRDDAAALYEIALVSGEDANAGTTAGNVVGAPFAVPAGRRAEIELARVALAVGEEATVPVAASSAPVLLLLTSGAAQIAAPGGETAELAAGQYALLLGEVIVRGASDAPAVFVVASIGEATGAGDDTGTPEARAARAGRQRDAGAAASGGSNPRREERTRERRTRRERTGGRGGQRGQGGQGAQAPQGGQGGQAAPQGTGGGVSDVPVTGGVEAPDAIAASPTPEPSPEEAPPLAAATPPADSSVLPDGTPTPETPPPTGDEASVAETPAAGDTVPENEATAEEPPAETTPTLTEPEPPAGPAPPTEPVPPAETTDQAPSVDETPLEEGAEATLPVEAGG